MSVFKCMCMHEYMYVCMHVCIVFVYTCVHASMCICMYVYMYACVHTCMYNIFKLGFERYGGIVLVGRGNCPGWNCPGGKCPGPAKPAFCHCTFSFITAHFVHHCTLKNAIYLLNMIDLSRNQGYISRTRIC